METKIVSASMDNLTEVMDFVREYLGDSEYSIKDVYHVMMSVEEIVTNIVSYAYGQQEDGQIEISCGFVDDAKKRLRIRFRDRGVAYNPLERSDPDLAVPFDQRPVGGLGIFLVKLYMDATEYRYEDGCNCLTIEKVF